MTSRAAGPGFWTVVVLLLGTARRRAWGRFRLQMKQRRRRGGRTTAAWPLVGAFFVVLLAALLNGGAAVELALTLSTAERVQAEANGRVVVEEWFAGRTEQHEADAVKNPAKRADITRAEDKDIAVEAPRLVRETGRDARTIAAQLRATVRHRPKAFLSDHSLWWQPGALPDMIALIAVIWWALMLVCQGEGPELDAQRPRNPMWEWLFSHPASPAAIFLAEMIAPVAANPAYLTAPLFPGMLFGIVYGWGTGLTATIVVGVPVTIALACVAKAIEIRVLLRLSPRARGAVLGLMGWFGFAAMLPFYLLATAQPNGVPMTMERWLVHYADHPWPPVRMLIGRTAGGDYVLWRGLVLCWLVAAVLTLAAVLFSVASARDGLVGRTLSNSAGARVAAPARFGREPLYRKELLWLRRDGRALIQAVLVPLSLAALQTFNLRGIVNEVQSGWTTISGVAILFGTYFLLTLGPKSLASEGQALWIAQTWPRGLESLLKAKAKLWALIGTVLVEIVLVYAIWRYPADAGRIVLVGLLWVVFARALAEKTVTLATMTSSSGEQEKIPAGHRWAVMLGTLTYAIGVMTHQWGIAITGVVYSMLTAAAMWQNFRYRLPFLSDPWSEVLPPAPTLLHAMVAISVMVEGIAALSVLALLAVGREQIAPINTALYGLCAIVAAVAVSRFLARRGVAQRDVWLWRDGTNEPRRFRDLDGAGRVRVAGLVVLGAALGTLLGAAAHGYITVLHHWPDLAHLIDEGQRRLNTFPHAHTAYVVSAVAFAPLAEEFLFRGLLYRALDREWGGWRAVLGAGAFFAIYHPVLAWAPVGALGAMNALLFRRTGRLAPAVAAHMAYNTIVLVL